MNEKITYHEDQSHISASLLKAYAKSPMTAWRMLNEEPSESEALTLGRCFHELMERGEHSAFVFDPDERPEPEKTFASKMNKEWKEMQYANHAEVISVEQDDLLQRMAASVKSSRVYFNLCDLVTVSIEKAYYDTVAGIDVKCKPDAVYEQADGGLLVVDWKTTSEALTTNPYQYRRIIAKYGYDLQAVHYSEILHNLTGKAINFVFVFVDHDGEVMPVYVPRDGEMYQQTFSRWLDTLQRLDNSMKSDNWPSVGDAIDEVIIF